MTPEGAALLWRPRDEAPGMANVYETCSDQRPDMRPNRRSGSPHVSDDACTSRRLEPPDHVDHRTAAGAPITREQLLIQRRLHVISNRCFRSESHEGGRPRSAGHKSADVALRRDPRRASPNLITRPDPEPLGRTPPLGCHLQESPQHVNLGRQPFRRPGWQRSFGNVEVLVVEVPFSWSR